MNKNSQAMFELNDTPKSATSRISWVMTRAQSGSQLLSNRVPDTQAPGLQKYFLLIAFTI